MQLQQNLLSNTIRITEGGTTLARCLKWRQESQASLHPCWPITECRLFSGRRIILGELPLFIWGHCLERGLISKPSTGDTLSSKGNENLYLLGFWVAHHSIHFKINQKDVKVTPQCLLIAIYVIKFIQLHSLRTNVKKIYLTW